MNELQHNILIKKNYITDKGTDRYHQRFKLNSHHLPIYPTISLDLTFPKHNR